MKHFQAKLNSVLETMSRKQFCQITDVPASSLSAWLTSDIEPNDLRKAQIASDLGLESDFFLSADSVVMKEDKTGSKIKMTVKEASELLGCSIEFIHAGLQTSRFPWGYAVQRDNTWSYWINGPKLRQIEGV